MLRMLQFCTLTFMTQLIVFFFYHCLTSFDEVNWVESTNFFFNATVCFYCRSKLLEVMVFEALHALVNLRICPK